MSNTLQPCVFCLFSVSKYKFVVNRKRLHSLLIGIDKYSDPTQDHFATNRIENLTGAVADMESVKAFLEGQLIGSEVGSIQTLKDYAATRKAIVDAIGELGEPDNHIRPGDAILIYYAGHGLSTTKEDRREEAIVPHGAPKIGASFKDLISHSKFSWLLKNLAESKGDNIVCSTRVVPLKTTFNHAPRCRPSFSTAVTLRRLRAVTMKSISTGAWSSRIYQKKTTLSPLAPSTTIAASMAGRTHMFFSPLAENTKKPGRRIGGVSLRKNSFDSSLKGGTTSILMPS
jgi:hypothetical protein